MVNKSKVKLFLFFALIILYTAFQFSLVMNLPLFGDEIQHYRTINEIYSFKVTSDTFLRVSPKLPGYFLTIAGIKILFGINSLPATRFITYIFSIMCIFVFYLIAKDIDKKSAKIKTLEFLFFPFFAIFFYILYTDIFSLFLLLSAYLLLRKKHNNLSGLVGIMSILVRQNNIIWLTFYLCLLARNYNLRKSKEIIRFIKDTWVYFIGFMGFITFVFINQGAAFGESNQKYHPVSLHTGNLFFLLIISFIFLIFPILFNMKQLLSLFRKTKYLLLTVALLLFYFFTFKSDHFWNSMVFDYYLRNRMLDIIFKTTTSKLEFFLPLLLTFLYLANVRLREGSKNFFYFFSILFLCFSWLIDPRYYIIPISFFILLKEEENKKIELLTIVLYMVLSVLIFMGTITRVFFV